MFTREELMEKVPSFIGLPKRPVEVISFDQDAFPQPASEESIVICRGVKTNFDNVIHFWIAAMQCEDWEGREEYFLPYLNGAMCQGIDEQAFRLMLSQLQGLKHPIVITPEGNYIWGQKMVDEWDDLAALAEFEHEYLSFHWETTA